MEFIICTLVVTSVLSIYFGHKRSEQRKYRRQIERETKNYARELAYQRAKCRLQRKWDKENPHKARMIKIYGSKI